MSCYCDLTADERLDHKGDPWCAIHVACDDNCKALLLPDTAGTLDAFVEAYIHWRHHRHMGGCSHGH